MIEPEARSPVRSLQDRLEKTGKVDKHVAHQEEPARRGREGERERGWEREGGRGRRVCERI